MFCVPIYNERGHDMKKSISFGSKLLSAFLAILLALYVYPFTSAAADDEEWTSEIDSEIEPGEYFPEEIFEPAEDTSDEETAESVAEVTGEVESMRSETVKHYRLSDGRYAAVDYGAPVHYTDGDGKWTDFDNTMISDDSVLKDDPDDFAGYEPKKNKADIKFAKNTNSSNLLKIKYEDCKISFGIQGANNSKPIMTSGSFADGDPFALPKVKSEVRYPNIFSGVDLVYILNGEDIKEYFVLSENASVFEYKFEIKVNKVTPSIDESGNVVFAKDDGSVVFTVPKGYMYDSSDGYSSENTSESVTYSLEQTKDKKYLLTVTVDSDWISAEDRVFPVFVDPSVILSKYSGSFSGNIHTEYLNTSVGTLDGTDHIYIGHDGTGGSDLYAHMKVNTLPALPDNCTVCDASFLVYNMRYSALALPELYVGLYESSSSDAYTAASSVMYDYAVYSASNENDFSQYGVTELARKWYSDSSSNHGILLKAENNTASSYANVRLAGCYAADSVLTTYQPRFIVTYRHTAGLEGYYAYESADVDRAGTLYLNANTGQTVLVNDLFTSDNLALPYTVSLIYNSTYSKTAFSNNAAANIHTADYTKMKLGYGWKLNSQTSVKEITLPSYINGSDSRYLIYCDADGTEHYFAQSAAGSSIYKDEDGLGLQIEVLSDITYGKYKMTDDKGSVTVFSHYGYIISSADANGNKITYNYDTAADVRRLESIGVSTDGGSYAVAASFIYSSDGYLTGITDRFGRKTTLSYSSSRLVKITYPDNQYASYDYSDLSGSSNSQGKLAVIRDNESSSSVGIDYEPSGKRVSAIKENVSGSTVNGSRLSVSYAGSEKTTVRFSGNDGAIGNSDDISNIYLFDYAGRCVNLHTAESASDRILGSAAAVYTSPSQKTDKRTNRIGIAASTGAQPVNLLLNTSAETVKSSDSTLAEYFYRSSLASGQTVERSTAYSHSGSASMKVSSSAAVSSEAYTWMQISRLTVGANYTLSAYAKASSLSASDTGGYYLRACTTSGQSPVYSENFSKSGSSDGGWIRISVNFTAVESTMNLCAGIRNASGTVCFDDFQLVLSDSCDSPVSLIPNGGFENTRTTNNWTMTSGAAYSSTGGIGNSRCIKVTASPLASRGANYTVPINAAGQNTYIYSGWAKATSVPLTRGVKPSLSPEFELVAHITYSDGTTEWHSKAFSADCREWQFLSMPIVPKKPSKTVSQIRLYVSYSQNGNTAYFDNVSLVADNCTAYEYDSNGNVTAVNRTKESPVSATYSGADLTRYASGTGATFNYTYDSAHNVTKVTWDGMTNALTYNAAGLPASSTLSGGGQTISTTATYDSYGRLTAETNQLGNQTKYSYNTLDGTLRLTEHPDGSKTVRDTITSNGRLRLLYTADSASAFESSANLSYSAGRLSEIRQGVAASQTDTVKNQYYRFTYNNWGDLTKVRVGDIILAENTYNQYTGAPITSKTPGGTILYRNYDNLGRVTDIRHSISNGTRLFENFYTASGEIGKTVDFTAGGNAVTVNTFDSLGRLSNVSVRNRTDGALRQNSSYVYDTAGRLKSSVTSFPFTVGKPYSNSFTYSASNGLLTSVTATNTDTLTPTYNGLKQVTSVKIDHNDKPFCKNYSYVEVSSGRTSSLPDKLEYTASDTTVLYLRNTYGYDAGNRISTVMETAGTGSPAIAGMYRYDGFGKLTIARTAAGTGRYTYDATGNITQITNTKDGTTETVTLEYDTSSGWKDRLMKVNGSSLQYYGSSPGLPSVYQNGRTYNLTWNGTCSELTRAVVGGTTVDFSYFFGGLRKTKTSGGVTKNYYYDGDRLIAEKWSTGAYLLYHYDETGSPYAITYSATGGGYAKYYLIKNLQGDVLQIRNVNNAVVANYEYDAWGRVVSIKYANGNDINVSNHIGVINPIRYRGYYYDSETGFYYLKSRYYDPAICRFISADYLLLVGGSSSSLNLFAYCGNNPIMFIDPEGNCPHDGLRDVSGMFLYNPQCDICLSHGEWCIPKKTVKSTMPIENGKFSDDYPNYPSGRYHGAADIGANEGTPIVAAFDGIIDYPDTDWSYGNNIVMNSNLNGENYKVIYAHMLEVVAFRLGTYVEAGTVIGYVGETGNAFGPHLHLEMRRYPYTHMADNVDPKQFFGFN